MKAGPLLLATIPLSVAAGVLALRAGPAAERDGSAGETARALADLEQALARAGAENARLAEQLEARRAPGSGGPETGPAGGDGARPEAIQRTLEAWLAENLRPAPRPAPRQATEEEEILSGLGTDELLALLESADGAARSRIWNALGQAGRIQELLAALEARAQEPGNVAARLLLADGSMHARAFARDLLESWGLAERADELLGEVLALDPAHFEARYEKGLALAEWPAYLGRTREAIEHFEFLCAEGARSGLRPEHARIYLYLGSLLQQSGAAAQALDVWREGLGLFPDDADLRARLERNAR